MSEHRRRDLAVAAAIMAFAAACVLTPVADALAVAVGTNLVGGLLLVAVAAYPLAYGVTAFVARDAGRVISAGDRRRRELAELERRVDAVPLPFDCDPDAFAALVDDELAALPAAFAEAIERNGVHVALAEQHEGQPFVLGLFSRRPVAPGAALGGGARADVVSEITLFRRPLIRAARVPERLAVQVRETLLHEVGHLLGMSEADLDRFTIGNRPRPDAVVVRPRT